MSLFTCDATFLGVAFEHKDLEASAIASFGYPLEDGVVGEVVVIEVVLEIPHGPLTIANCDQHVTEGSPIDFTGRAYDTRISVAQKASDGLAKITKLG